jgi:hypothetical protein
MKDQTREKIVQHVQLFLTWWHLVKTSFPPLWAAAAMFAPLVLSRCPICQKPRFWLWIPTGDHKMCERLEPQDPADPLPPFG